MPKLDLSPLQPVLETYGPQGRTALLPALHAAQEIYRYLPEEVAAAVATALNVPLVDVFGVIDFYALFYREPVGNTVVHVCNDPACAMAGAETVFKRMQQHTEGHLVTVERAPCLGLCEHAPALLVQGSAYAGRDNLTYADLVAGKGGHPKSIVGGTVRLLTANCGRGVTTSLAEYERGGGYQALRSALSADPQSLIDAIKASGLVGRGGAAFPTGLKWEGAARAPGTLKYVVCNADEAEPGTFKDRVLMEDDPHRVLEGLILSAYATGAEKGYWYIRGEYTLQYRIVQAALDEARQAGYLGDDILGSALSFDVELRRGAGAYICGEETALFESIEGKRGFPRVKPPFPTTHGLFGRPTVINNVETLANVPLILQIGAEAYRRYGTEKSPGPKLFCVSGDVNAPGLYEVPFGVTLREMIDDLAGGSRTGHHFQGALIGGAAGAFAGPEDLDVRLTFEDLRAAGLPLGSGVITVFDETRDLHDILVRLARFFAEESCGKCYPCQMGTQRQLEIMERVYAGQPLEGDQRRLLDLGATMTDASLCGLGQTASTAILSALRKWPEQFQNGGAPRAEVS